MKAIADSLIPRKDNLQAWIGALLTAGRVPGLDASVAPTAANKLRYHYAKVYEHKYGQFKLANGEVLGFDTSPDKADKSYSYEIVDYAGYADWIGDDGVIMGEGSMSTTEHVGFMHRIGHKFSFTVFDLERAVKQGKQLPATRQRIAKKAHDAKMNWTFAFGDSGKKLHGLFTHPNIQVVLAPVSATATYSDNRDRLTENKDVDEILADLETIVETVPRTTNEELRTAKVCMPYHDISVLKRRRVGAGDGSLTIWQLIQDLYPDVQFMSLPECDDAKRVDPKTGTNTSSISGQCWIALPDLPADECGFVMVEPFTQRPPQEHDLKITTATHSKFGGFKCVQPLGVVRMDFVAADSQTAAP
ncbi:MAG: major capsid family protein [Planctomycetota bacterium]|nr:major capsid family protein [Planctomycetota bacterium]